jgi:hypothetical protein
MQPVLQQWVIAVWMHLEEQQRRQAMPNVVDGLA